MDHMAVLFLVFKGISILSSKEAVSVYIPTNCAGGFPFLHILSSIYCLWIFFMTTILTSPIFSTAFLKYYFNSPQSLGFLMILLFPVGMMKKHRQRAKSGNIKDILK